MKKWLLITGLCAGLFSCTKSGGFLDNKTTGLDEAQTFSDTARTLQFLGRIYTDIGFSFNKGRVGGTGNTEGATDDAEYSYSSVTNLVIIWYNGTNSPIIMNGSDFWNTPYSNIRRCNLLMSKLPTTPLSAFTQSRVMGEAKFLRAWYYSQLMSTFGSVPLVEDKVFGLSDIINLTRPDFSEVVSYITKELDEAAALLPAAYNTSNGGLSDADFGRATRGACLALKARVLLYAASPLFNGGATTSNAALAKVVSYPSVDVARWKAAADAAEAVINLNSYSLWTGQVSTGTVPRGFGFYQTFLTTRTANTEMILGMYRPSNRDFESAYNPPSRGGANNMHATQNIVDAFPMINGKPITDPTSGYVATNPYVGRDPRFRYSIIFNASLLATSTGAQAPVYTYLNAPSDGYVPSATSSPTGYYTRKMCDTTFSTNGSGNVDRPWPLIRYAEILLNYAEAINEFGQTQLAYPRLREIRERAGIMPGTDNNYGMKANMTQAEMRAFIQNERRIELAFEDHRWNDIRRWKIAEQPGIGNGYNKAMRITATGTAPNFNYTYQVVNTERLHVFRPEHYLMPIPNDEIRKMPAMLQNPGW